MLSSFIMNYLPAIVKVFTRLSCFGLFPSLKSTIYRFSFFINILASFKLLFKTEFLRICNFFCATEYLPCTFNWYWFIMLEYQNNNTLTTPHWHEFRHAAAICREVKCIFVDCLLLFSNNKTRRSWSRHMKKECLTIFSIHTGRHEKSCV